MQSLLKTTQPDVRQDQEIKAPPLTNPYRYADDGLPNPPPRRTEPSPEEKFKEKFGFRPQMSMRDAQGGIRAYHAKLEAAIKSGSARGVSRPQPTDSTVSID